MTSYQPNPVVTFADVNVYSENTIANISINIGRDDVLDQPQAGYARIVLWTDASEPLNVNLSDSVTVAIDNGTAGSSTIFTGIISLYYESFNIVIKSFFSTPKFLSKLLFLANFFPFSSVSKHND
jgi:hypothetical protein